MTDGTGEAAPGSARFGEAPLAQTVAAAGAIRRLISLLLSLEHPYPTVKTMLGQFEDWERELAAAVPADLAPRIGVRADDDRRVYLDHATDIGAYNPCFPEYRFERLDSGYATGTVAFPLAYEGPPGLVHGGFIGVFFDCVMQHHNCVTGLSGKTRSLTVTFRRPTPVLTELRFEITRSRVDRAITSTARLLHDGAVVCVGEVNTVAARPDQLSTTQFGRRRKESDS